MEIDAYCECARRLESIGVAWSVTMRASRTRLLPAEWTSFDCLKL